MRLCRSRASCVDMGIIPPVFFSNRGHTTYTHQLALLYLFNSPFQCLAENPVALLNDPVYKPILPLLKTLPVTWDETRVLRGSKIGELAAFARRKGKDWYIAVINGTDSTVSFELQPSFLPTGKKFRAALITDTAGDNGFVGNTTVMKASVARQFRLLPAGGLVIQIKNE